MRTATARSRDAKISLKHSLILCREIRGKRLGKAKALLEDLIAQRRALSGRYYTNASKKFLELLKSAEANASFRGLDPERLYVKTAKADKGYKFLKPKSRFRFRGREAKITRVELVLEER